MNKADLLLFDLGGVFVEWDGIGPLRQISGRPMSPEDARRFWLESPWVRLFEAGRCTSHEFADGVISELEIKMEREAFLAEFVSWDRGPLPGAVDLLKILRERWPLACLSNNNELHWQILQDHHQITQYFKYAFASHEIGAVKPDREIFEYVLENTGLQSSQILFFDDNPECVKAARVCGLQARQALGPGQVRDHLLDLGYL